MPQGAEGMHNGEDQTSQWLSEMLAAPRRRMSTACIQPLAQAVRRPTEERRDVESGQAPLGHIAAEANGGDKEGAGRVHHDCR